MASPNPRQSRYSLPKPETGVAEWASKIKAMQQQVDADEEAEQRKLEKEIEASRIARLRRSRGLGRPQSLDLVHDNASSIDDDASTVDSFKSPTERQKGHSDALDKLMGSSSASASQSRAPPPVKKSENMSLASFMGGHATGPRLNKPAPQQDSYDSTLFEQRREITAPHPIFGRGGIGISGVAMPGMSSSTQVRPFPVSTTNIPTTNAISTHKPEPQKERSISPQKRERTMSTPNGSIYFNSRTTNAARTSTPSVATRYMESIKERDPIPPRMTEGRERTISNPGSSSYRQPVNMLASASERPSAISESRPKTPVSEVTRPKTPVQYRSPPPTPKSPVSLHSLTRPSQPDVQPVSRGPQIPASVNPSPAFLKPPGQKDPTPSLSRLQGRGFVQNMVKVSQNLEGTPDASNSIERHQTGKKPSVLDRWPAAKNSPPSPPTAPKPVVMKKSVTIQLPPKSPSKPPEMRKSMTSEADRIPLHVTGNIPEVDTDIAHQHVSGLGSATTLVVVKSTPTGGSVKTQYPDVDELGVQHSGRGSSRVSLPEVNTKPLVHPTRDRARKPRKERSSGDKFIHVVEPPTESASHAPPNTSVTLEMVGPPKSPHITDRWSTHNVIGIKPLQTHDLPPPLEQAKGSGMVGRRALPGMTAGGFPPKSPTILFTPSVRSSPPPEEKHPHTPSRHSRIPSTGNRATVMDVAQVLNEQANIETVQSPVDIDQVLPKPPTEDIPSENKAISHPPNALPLPPSVIERRRSSYERYSAMALPPLKEEATPTPSPMGTLARNKALPITTDTHISKATDLKEETEGAHALDDDMVHLNISDTRLPKFNIKEIVQSRPQSVSLNAYANTVSVDVMVIQENATQTLNNDQHIFHDTETLAIVHRAKSKSSALVATTVWAWHGKQSQLGEKGKQRLSDLGKRYGASIIPIRQFAEPHEFVHILGGQLIIRQGVRAHWSAENTSMHIIRSCNGAIFIDEHDLNIKNLCSGFSYCIAVLGNVYVWHGCGSLEVERSAAMTYARTLASDVIELTQGVNDDNEMFWMVLGDEEYAIADYWRWRPSAPALQPEVWLIDCDGRNSILPVESFCSGPSVRDSTFVVNCIWEIYVVVGMKCRAKRRDIRLGMNFAKELSVYVAKDRPYTPSIHVLVCPTQLPIELRLHFRDTDELLLNDDKIPDHMNILSMEEALNHLQTKSWSRKLLNDTTVLPLGLDESIIL